MDATISDPLVGRVLDDRYEVQSRIARGGMATVYLALDRRLDREVALKVLHHHLADDVEFTVRFVREARSAARLSHPNVVQVYDQGEDDGHLYLAMEYLRGRTLRDVLTERGVLTPRETLMVAESVLDAPAAAHRAGIVHRDVKPENVVLTDEGRIKVADFGLARAATASTATSSMLLGTVAYLSPELVGRGIADARSDVYAVGVMLFEMLTGQQPFTGDVPIQVAYRHVNEDVPAPSTLVPGLAPELDDLVLAAAARDPDDRPADAAALLTLVRQAHAALTDHELDARPAGAPQPAPPDPTQVVPPGGDWQRTQALPGLARSGPPTVGVAGAARPSGPAGPLLRPLDRSDDDPFGRGPARPMDEDADLALLADRRRRRGAIGLASVLVLAVMVGVVAWFFAFGPGSKVTVPRVVGLSQADAQKALQARGLTVAVQQAFDDAQAGQVVDTDPSAGNRIGNGGKVTLVVSKGPDLVTVPDIKSTKLADAIKALSDSGLTAGTPQEVYDPTAVAGTVVDSSPASGKQAKRQSTVELTVSKGPQPVDVPDLTNKTQDDAVNALNGLGLRNSLTQEFSDTVPVGTVIRQDPPAPATKLPGESVTLVVSKGPPVVTVPDLTGQQYDEAKKTLEALGLKVVRDNFLGGVFGTVRRQDPGAGQVPAGSTITLTVV